MQGGVRENTRGFWKKNLRLPTRKSSKSSEGDDEKSSTIEGKERGIKTHGKTNESKHLA